MVIEASGCEQAPTIKGRNTPLKLGMQARMRASRAGRTTRALSGDETTDVALHRKSQSHRSVRQPSHFTMNTRIVMPSPMAPRPRHPGETVPSGRGSALRGSPPKRTAPLLDHLGRACTPEHASGCRRSSSQAQATLGEVLVGGLGRRELVDLNLASPESIGTGRHALGIDNAPRTSSSAGSS